MEVDLPGFASALARFTQFLELHQVNRPTLRWIFREDVALRGRSLLVSRRLPVDRTSLVEQKYASAVARAARGVMLSAEGFDDVAVYCTLVVPVSEDDAEERWIRGLKLSMRNPLLPVVTLEEPAWREAVHIQTPAQVAGLDDRFQRSVASSY
jgi:hypothetical protein